MTQTYKVVVADDHPLIRASVVALLNSAPDLEVAADVGTADEALRATATQKPDVVVLDLRVRVGGGVFRRLHEVRNSVSHVDGYRLRFFFTLHSFSSEPSERTGAQRVRTRAL